MQLRKPNQLYVWFNHLHFSEKLGQPQEALTGRSTTRDPHVLADRPEETQPDQNIGVNRGGGYRVRKFEVGLHSFQGKKVGL